MPEPGDLSPGFIAVADRCWRMVYDRNLQATHCRGADVDGELAFA
jgi:hypothetical protein